MRILSIALKDLQQITRDKRSLLFLIAMPIVFTLFMGFAYGSGTSTAADERLALGWGWVPPYSRRSSCWPTPLLRSESLPGGLRR